MTIEVEILRTLGWVIFERSNSLIMFNAKHFILGLLLFVAPIVVLKIIEKKEGDANVLGKGIRILVLASMVASYLVFPYESGLSKLNTEYVGFQNYLPELYQKLDVCFIHGSGLALIFLLLVAIVISLILWNKELMRLKIFEGKPLLAKAIHHILFIGYIAFSVGFIFEMSFVKMIF